VNGNWRIDLAGAFEAAGTVFHYERKTSKSEDASEK
jgi:hypothetical protein